MIPTVLALKMLRKCPNHFFSCCKRPKGLKNINDPSSYSGPSDQKHDEPGTPNRDSIFEPRDNLNPTKNP